MRTVTSVWDQLGRRPDLPTYVGGWLATVAWLAVVGSTVGDAPFNVLMILLTTVGFAVSFVLRGYRGTREWLVLQQTVVRPTTVLRFLFLVLGVLPGLLGIPPCDVLVPELATGTDEWLLATGYMWLVAIYSFGMLSDGLVAFTSVMGVAMFGLMAVFNINPELGVGLLVFLLGNVLMLSNMALAHHAGRRLPGGRAMARWFVDQSIIAGLIVAVTAFVSIGLAYLLQRFSPPGLVPDRLAAVLGSPGRVTGYAGFGDRIELGSADAISSTPLFEAWSSRPALWRRRVYERYTGHGWQGIFRGGAGAIARRPSRTVEIAFNQRYLEGIGARVEIQQRLKFLAAGELVAVPLVTRITFPYDVGTMIDLDRQGDPLLQLPAGIVIEMTSEQAAPTPDQLRACQRVEPEDWRWLLEVPTTARETILPVAQQLAAGKDNPYDIAEAIRQYLETTFVYDASVSVPRRYDDTMQFYFETRRGACDLIATAMVLLARANGIPARVAVGFAPGTPQPNGTRLIRQSDAHAWAELYFEGYGWIAYNPAVPSPEEAAEEVTAVGGRARFRLDLRSLGWLVIVLATGWLLLYTSQELARARPAYGQGDAARVAEGYCRAMRQLARRSWERRRHETPRQHYQRICREHPDAPWLAPLETLVTAYEAARYELRPVDGVDVRRVTEALDRLRKELRRYRSRPPAPGKSQDS